VITEHRLRWLAAAWLTQCLLAGCGASQYEPPSAADPAVARSALEKALNCWRGRITPDELRSAMPPIAFADEDWHAGRRLIEFQLLPGHQTAGSTLRWPVRLRLAHGSGRERVVEATYVISTDPAIHISRAD
jgi:hypothetical protein